MEYSQSFGTKYIYAKRLEWCLMCTQNKVLDCCFYCGGYPGTLYLYSHIHPFQWPELRDVPEVR